MSICMSGTHAVHCCDYHLVYFMRLNHYSSFRHRKDPCVCIGAFF